MTEKELISEKQVRLVAAYSVRIIESYLAEVCAASYPQPPELSPAYVYFDAHYQNILRMVNGEHPKDILESMKKDP